MKRIAPPGYRTVELDEEVAGSSPELVTRFRWRAERRCKNANARRLVDSYRYEVRRVHDTRRGKPTRWRWAVVAMQNQAVPVKTTRKEP